MSVVGSLVSFLGRDAFVEAGIQEGLRLAGATEADLPPGALDQAREQAAGSALGSLIVSLVIVAAVAAVIVQMRNGRNWARIVLTVLGVLGVLAGAVALIGLSLLLGAGVLGLVVVLASAVQIILAVAAIVMMYRPAAKAYFART
ncbi:hypothetical protein [Pseudonocardia hydrocarbonoxydans]|uniref:Uncharacterized protein n=1 Tax=Pseudonocardia hydrocarbonoxydans TaxID=76726 RepID=A0A4Y3WR00_9PSEU|nr:hypothetical protein [Pseudonocardia hydrocarbonoxydans]GEC20510.1 hypothetical protein PHY01_27930 [Pseudonocardia hydrocarbonoxydans]